LQEIAAREHECLLMEKNHYIEWVVGRLLPLSFTGRMP